VEVITMKIQNMRRSSTQSPQPAGPADTNASRQEIQVPEQPNPKLQDQNAAANPNAPNSTGVNGPSAAPDANAGTNAANPPQNIPATTGNQTSAGQKKGPPAQFASVNGAQPAGQNAA